MSAVGHALLSIPPSQFSVAFYITGSLNNNSNSHCQMQDDGMIETVNGFLEAVGTAGYDLQIIQCSRCISANKEETVFELTLPLELCNSLGSMHGGQCPLRHVCVIHDAATDPSKRCPRDGDRSLHGGYSFPGHGAITADGGTTDGMTYRPPQSLLIAEVRSSPLSFLILYFIPFG